MRYLWLHITAIIEQYAGELPLTHYLRGYFKRFPVLGSRDRRMLSTLAYCWYRAAKGVAGGGYTREQQLGLCLRLCGAWDERFARMFADVDIPDDVTIDVQRLFPDGVALSGGITREEWLTSMLRQPDLFIRVRRNRQQIEGLLQQAGIPYRYVTENCMALPNGAAIDKLLPQAVYVVQDASSQATGRLLDAKTGERWYDCCCGAGGKSLMLVDSCPHVLLTASDRRATILNNLRERFRMYSLPMPLTVVADAADAVQVQRIAGGRPFDNIIADVPCTGSGTWARTPEQLYFFDTGKVAELAALQARIAINAAAALRPGGRLIYITCSVFRQENEDVVQTIVAETGLKVVHEGLINGIDIAADCMYAAVLQ